MLHLGRWVLGAVMMIGCRAPIYVAPFDTPSADLDDLPRCFVAAKGLEWFEAETAIDGALLQRDPTLQLVRSHDPDPDSVFGRPAVWSQRGERDVAYTFVGRETGYVQVITKDGTHQYFCIFVRHRAGKTIVVPVYAGATAS